MHPKQTRWAGEGLERLCQGTVAGWITSTGPAGGVESLQRVVRGRGSSRVIPGDHREGEPVAIAQAEDASEVNLSNQLDLVRGISGFVGLKRQTPVAAGDEDADEEVSNLPCFLQREWEHAQFLHGKIVELERERQQAIRHDRGQAIEKVRQLLRLRAIGPNGAWVYVNESFGWRQVRNRKEVGAAAGLIPTPYAGREADRTYFGCAGNRHAGPG